jgi:Rieske Fe-S protein
VLVRASGIRVGKGKQVRDPATGHTDWVLHLRGGQFTAYDPICPHQGCSVDFVSPDAGFACPCHGSRFDARGRRTAGPAPSGLTAIQVSVEDGEVRST